MKQEFYSNGKLLITGEYLVLDGAKAFALPTKFGQNLLIDEGKNQEITWKSYDSDGKIWFEENISFAEISAFKIPEMESVKTTLLEILHQAFLLNPDFLKTSKGYTITTQLTFPRKWGLGTSSTLINNIAQWLQIDAFELLNNSFGGSGYDIACAQNNFPILYHLEQGKAVVEKITFAPEFSQNIYFVYLNKKQNSKSSIAKYRTNKSFKPEKTIEKIDALTQVLLHTNDLSLFSETINAHEALMSHVLETSTVKETLFPDFEGAIKSLGAWGGDFIMVVAKEDPSHYFSSKGFDTIITYKDMILS